MHSQLSPVLPPCGLELGIDFRTGQLDINSGDMPPFKLAIVITSAWIYINNEYEYNSMTYISLLLIYDNFLIFYDVQLYL